MSIIFDFTLRRGGWVHEIPGPGEKKILPPESNDSWSLVKLKQRDLKSGDFLGSDKKEFIFNFLLNDRTKQLYLIDKSEKMSYRSVKAFDCIILSLLNPFHFAAAVAWNFGRIFYDISAVAFNAISNSIRAVQNQSVWLALRNNFRQAGNEFKGRLKQDIINIGRAFYYALGIEIAAVEGILLDSYKAIANIAMIERDWNKKSHHSHVGVIFDYPHLIKGGATFQLGFYAARAAGNLDYDKTDNRLPRWKLVEQISGDKSFSDDPRTHIPVLPIFSFALDFFKRRRSEKRSSTGGDLSNA